MFLKTKTRLKPQIIINPESDKGRTGRKWKHIKEAIRTFYKEFHYEFTEKPCHATEISRSAIKEGAELIVGVGGDGTMNEIANGFFEHHRIINPEAALGVVPSGTGSDFSRSLNLPSGFHNAIQTIYEAPSNHIDTGHVRFKTASDQDCERYFVNITDFGIGGEVVRHMSDNRMKRKKSSYLRSTLSTFANYRNKRLRIRVDGRELPEDDYMIGAVSNGRIFGKGMKIAPDAQLDDGLFDLVLVKGMKMWDFCRNVLKIYRGTHLRHPKIALIQGSEIEVFPAANEKQDVLLEVDGEQLGQVPATFKILPRTLLVKSFLN